MINDLKKYAEGMLARHKANFKTAHTFEQKLTELKQVAYYDGLLNVLDKHFSEEKDDRQLMLFS